MKKYGLNISVSLSTGEAYSPQYPLKFSITENLPADIDAKKYIKQRLNEEVERHFSQLPEPIENVSDKELSDNPLGIE